MFLQFPFLSHIIYEEDIFGKRRDKDISLCDKAKGKG